MKKFLIALIFSMIALMAIGCDEEAPVATISDPNETILEEEILVEDILVEDIIKE